MTASELGLTLFIFGLVYGAVWVPRFGAWVGGLFAGSSEGRR